MEEMLDIVNESDEVIGQGSRREVHRLGKMHRATHIILTNSARQIFIQLRALSKDTNPGLWDSSAAGHVDSGESYIMCAARELEEELGVSVASEQLLEIGRVGPSECNGFEFVRIYTVESDSPITLEAGEIDDGKWVEDSELGQMIDANPKDFATSFIEIWKTIRPWRESR